MLNFVYFVYFASYLEFAVKIVYVDGSKDANAREIVFPEDQSES